MAKRLDPEQIDPKGHPDGEALTLVGGEPTWSGPRSMVVPLIAVVDGSPEFVYDADHQLVMTEVPR